MKRAELWVPKWLVDRTGVDYFGHVVSVELPYGVVATDELMIQVGRLHGTEKLSLRAAIVSDSALRHIKGLTRLRDLDLDFTGISDADMAYLSEMTSLETLRLDKANIVDDSLAVLERMAVGLGLLSSRAPRSATQALHIWKG